MVQRHLRDFTQILPDPVGPVKPGLAPTWSDLGSLRVRQVSFHCVLSMVKLF